MTLRSGRRPPARIDGHLLIVLTQNTEIAKSGCLELPREQTERAKTGGC
jgi:hypothetical protein